MKWNVAQQLRRSVSHLPLREEVSFGCDVRNQSEDPWSPYRASPGGFSRGEYVQSRNTRGFASLFDVVISVQPAYELRFMSDDRENATEIKQVPRLNTFNLGANRSGAASMRSAASRRSAFAGFGLFGLTICLSVHRRPRAAPPQSLER